ncbi:alpha/beta fold hydrolase [Peribacillus sp. NPDC097675]|uniref:alpha/beta fold hydrolase n=1 Tax=Peribacillus sp. NPDC097675 TaxID=3390618 RepID=UPI003CFC3E97
MILHTSISGEGFPLVLVHSGGMTGVKEYEEQCEFFSQRNFKVVRPDLRGHGQSEGPIDQYFSHCAEDLHDTLKDLQIEKCHIAGVSIGGIAALLFAKKYPDKVASLTFSGIFPHEPANWEDLTKQETENFEQLFENEEVVSILDEIHGKNDWKALLRSFQEDDFYPFDETGDVSNLRVPTLCLFGEAEENERSAAISYKQLKPDVHVSIIPLAGHLVHRDQPELYSQTLYTFIESLDKEIIS